MNSQLEAIVARFVEDVRRLSSYEAVHFEVLIGTNEHDLAFKYKLPEQLKREGISMRNLKGEWIRAAEKEESPKTVVQQANYEICPKCGGSGRVYMCAEDGDGIKCHRCSGSGKLS